MKALFLFILLSICIDSAFAQWKTSLKFVGEYRSQPYVDSPTPASSAFTYGSVSCGGPLTFIGKKGASTSAIQSPNDFYEDCTQQFYRGSGLAQAQGSRKAGYDTLKIFVEHCAPNGAFTTWDAFPRMSGAIQYMGGDFSRYLEYREWLKSVLYLDQIHPEHYCAAAEAIGFTYLRDGSTHENLKAQQAIIQYLLESGKCEDFDGENLRKSYGQLTELIHKKWADTTTVDTSLVKMDTTLPTLDDLDLEILRGPEFANVLHDPNRPALLEVKALTNPFSTTTEIEYTLGTTAQVQLTLFNALGHEIWSKPFGAVQDARTHRIEIGAELGAGSYFLRVATITGEVKTVKLVKQ